jgi:hypothetical protein
LRLGEREEEGNEKKPCTCTWPLEKGCYDASNAVTKDSVCSLIDVACAALRVRTPPKHQHQPLLIF